jgi:hypothetical protein
MDLARSLQATGGSFSLADLTVGNHVNRAMLEQSLSGMGCTIDGDTVTVPKKIEEPAAQ